MTARLARKFHALTLPGDRFRTLLAAQLPAIPRPAAQRPSIAPAGRAAGVRSDRAARLSRTESRPKARPRYARADHQLFRKRPQR